MRSLFLVQQHQRVILDSFYESICEHLGDCELRRLTSGEQGDLKAYFKSIDVERYDRIILFLRVKKELKQLRFIRTLPNLVILEHDASQNYIEGKYKGKFSGYYRKVPWARIICSGYTVSKKLKVEGFDAVFVPKGYDQSMLCDKNVPRDVNLGFVGSIKSGVYYKRREFLQKLEGEKGLVIAQTSSGREYVDTLNRIRIFVNSDEGLGEYMIKTFEAMACGCLMFAWSQGDEENAALGLRDMENIVLYSSYEEFCEKLSFLNNNQDLVTKIASAGKRLAAISFSWEEQGRLVAEAVKLPLRRRSIKKFLGFKFYRFSDM